MNTQDKARQYGKHFYEHIADVVYGCTDMLNKVGMWKLPSLSAPSAQVAVAMLLSHASDVRCTLNL